jgi:hypothetical protein
VSVADAACCDVEHARLIADTAGEVFCAGSLRCKGLVHKRPCRVHTMEFSGCAHLFCLLLHACLLASMAAHAYCSKTKIL